MKRKAYLGIDPGKTGAAGLIFQNGHRLLDWPGDVASLAEELEAWRFDFNIQLAALEAVHSMPKQGISSSFNFGCNLGQWMGVLAALHIPFIMPRPRQWRKGMFKKSDGSDTKTQSLTVARRLFPDAELNLKKHHGRAEALLLAWYAKKEGL
jgi:hypothetical protein